MITAVLPQADAVVVKVTHDLLEIKSLKLSSGVGRGSSAAVPLLLLPGSPASPGFLFLLAPLLVSLGFLLELSAQSWPGHVHPHCVGASP